MKTSSVHEVQVMSTSVKTYVQFPGQRLNNYHWTPCPKVSAI